MKCFENKCLQPNLDLGLFILRVSLGGMMLVHGITKAMMGVSAVVGMMAGMGIPEFAAHGVWFGEIVAPVLIILGLFTRPAAIVFAFTMVVATFAAHANEICTLSPHGGWAIELNALYFFGALALACTGGGKWSVCPKSCCTKG